MNKNNLLKLFKRQKEHKKQFPFRPIRKLNQHQIDFLKNRPYVLDGSIVYFSTWNTSDFIVGSSLNHSPLSIDLYKYPPFIIDWNRITREKSGIIPRYQFLNTMEIIKDYIENPQSFNDQRIKVSDDELSLLIKCMKQYVECMSNPIAMEEARKKVFLDR